MKDNTRVIFIFALLYCFLPAIAGQSKTFSGPGNNSLPSISKSFISAAAVANLPRQIKNTGRLIDFACLAVSMTVPAPMYAATGSRIYAGQAFTQTICHSCDSLALHKGRIPAAITHNLHPYHLVFPHHHFW